MRIVFRLFLFILCSEFVSCNPGKADVKNAVIGNWLILYPDHRMQTLGEREVYGKYQDSLVTLYGLKLISLSANGKFREVDSLYASPAVWTVSEDSLLKIREGGKGFNPFNTSFRSFAKDTLQLLHVLPLENKRLKVVWHFKKISDDTEAAKLFKDDANTWRQKPRAPETSAGLKKRLAAMLHFYGDYFKLVSKESIYFSPARVPLPFRYYQHAIEMNEVIPPAFSRLFYSGDDATRAYSLLEQTVSSLRNEFPGDENFVSEYGLFMKKMATELER